MTWSFASNCIRLVLKLFEVLFFPAVYVGGMFVEEDLSAATTSVGAHLAIDNADEETFEVDGEDAGDVNEVEAGSGERIDIDHGDQGMLEAGGVVSGDGHEVGGSTGIPVAASDGAGEAIENVGVATSDADADAFEVNWAVEEDAQEVERAVEKGAEAGSVSILGAAAVEAPGITVESTREVVEAGNAATASVGESMDTARADDDTLEDDGEGAGDVNEVEGDSAERIAIEDADQDTFEVGGAVAAPAAIKERGVSMEGEGEEIEKAVVLTSADGAIVGVEHTGVSVASSVAVKASEAVSEDAEEILEAAGIPSPIGGTMVVFDNADVSAFPMNAAGGGSEAEVVSGDSGLLATQSTPIVMSVGGNQGEEKEATVEKRGVVLNIPVAMREGSDGGFDVGEAEGEEEGTEVDGAPVTVDGVAGNVAGVEAGVVPMVDSVAVQCSGSTADANEPELVAKGVESGKVVMVLRVVPRMGGASTAKVRAGLLPPLKASRKKDITMRRGSSRRRNRQPEKLRVGLSMLLGPQPTRKAKGCLRSPLKMTRIV